MLSASHNGSSNSLDSNNKLGEIVIDKDTNDITMFARDLNHKRWAMKLNFKGGEIASMSDSSGLVNTVKEINFYNGKIYSNDDDESKLNKINEP